jgi:dihydropteroate synthase
VIGNLMYPLVLLLVGAGVVVASLVFFVPKFQDFFDKLPSLPLATRILLGASEALTGHAVLLTIASAAAVGVAGWQARNTLQNAVDTTKAAVASAAAAEGADIINDISGGAFDEGMVKTVATLGVPYIAMHTRGTPKTMRSLASYPGGQVTSIVCDELERVVRAAHAAGLAPWSLIVDPGIGFAKDPQQSMTLLHELPAFVQRIVGAQPGGGGGGGGGCCASLVGASRKGFIGQVLSQPDPLQRQWGNAATTVAATVAGVDIVRVHEVSEMRQVAMMADAIHRRAGGSGGAAPTPLAKL